MNKLASLINSLPAREVELIKKDLDEGNLNTVIQERLAELEVPQKVCPVCATELTDNAPFVLYFGTDIRKKARFDGKDCLKFFLNEVE